MLAVVLAVAKVAAAAVAAAKVAADNKVVALVLGLLAVCRL